MQASSPAPFGRSDVVILTVIPTELRAVLDTFEVRDTDRIRTEGGTLYYQKTARSALSGRPLRVAVSCVGRPGNPATASAVREAISIWHPRLVILVGIAAGSRGAVKLGNVILSERVVSYEPAAIVAGPHGPHEEPRPEVYTLPHVMAQQIANYRPSSARLNEDFNRAFGDLFPAVEAIAKDEVASKLEIKRTTIASGEKLLRDSDKQQKIRTLHGKVEAFDMESAGLVEACRNDASWLVIRGISDFGDAYKSDQFHELAARAAAVVLLDFLLHGLDLPPDDLPVTRTLGPELRTRAATPRYPDERTRRLSEELQDALGRQKALVAAGQPTQALDREVVQIKRQLREGGQLRPGDTLSGGRYLLLESIGRGGFATVWKAYDQTKAITVAIKVLHPDIAGDHIRRERFFRGARIMAKLAHSGVAQVFEPQAEDLGFLYFIMEYLPGGDLRSAVLQNRVAGDGILRVLLRVGEALALAHEQGIVHRDIKPANVLLDEHGEPKLTDFDLVSVGDTSGGTRTGALGTVVYTAPECWQRPQEADSRADVYGLGMTLLFCFYGADLPPDVIRRAETIIEELNCADAIRRLIASATRWDRNQRFSDANAFCKATREVIHDSTTPRIQSSSNDASDILYWIVDDRGIGETVWLTGSTDVRVVARTPGIVLSAAERVWVLKKVQHSIRLLAPDARSLLWAKSSGDIDSAYSLPEVDAKIDDMQLLDTNSGASMFLGSVQSNSDYEPQQGWFDLRQSVQMLASLGHYLFFRSDLYWDGGGAHGVRGTIFRVLDLTTGKDVDLVVPLERERLIKTEGRKAMEALKERDAYFDDDEDSLPELTIFTPSYDWSNKLRIGYQFTAGTGYALSDGRWRDYTISEIVDSDVVPGALQAYKDAPALLQRYWETSPRLGTTATWTAVSRSPTVRGLLRRVFEARGEP